MAVPPPPPAATAPRPTRGMRSYASPGSPYVEAPWDPGNARTSDGMARCQLACGVPDCRCEGFGSCIGRVNHASRPCRCSPHASPSTTPSAPTPTTRTAAGTSSRAPWMPADQAVRVNIHVERPGEAIALAHGHFGSAAPAAQLPHTQAVGSDLSESVIDRWIKPQHWPAGDLRRCNKCIDGGIITGYPIGDATAWK